MVELNAPPDSCPPHARSAVCSPSRLASIPQENRDQKLKLLLLQLPGIVLAEGCICYSDLVSQWSRDRDTVCCPRSLLNSFVHEQPAGKGKRKGKRKILRMSWQGTQLLLVTKNETWVSLKNLFWVEDGPVLSPWHAPCLLSYWEVPIQCQGHVPRPTSQGQMACGQISILYHFWGPVLVPANWVWL